MGTNFRPNPPSCTLSTRRTDKVFNATRISGEKALKRKICSRQDELIAPAAAGHSDGLKEKGNKTSAQRSDRRSAT